MVTATVIVGVMSPCSCDLIVMSLVVQHTVYIGT